MIELYWIFFVCCQSKVCTFFQNCNTTLSFNPRSLKDQDIQIGKKKWYFLHVLCKIIIYVYYDLIGKPPISPKNMSKTDRSFFPSRIVPHTFRDLPILNFEEDIIFERSLTIELSPVVTKAGCVLISNN